MIINPLDANALQTELSNCRFNSRLVFGSLGVNVHSNVAIILDQLSDYYKSYQEDTATEHEVDIFVIEQSTASESLDWQEVPREAGKQGKKEGYLDSESGRWIKKFKTGMLMLQRQKDPVVVGPCLQNIAQIINFINNQFINAHLCRGYLLGHASGFVVQGKVTAIAAGSGGGKSTLMLRCLENQQRQFLTNDRILMQATQDAVTAVGVAKLPRVNPGTLLHSERLKHILPVDQQHKMRQLTQQDLWVLEQKYDVQIEDEYGPDRVQLQGELTNLLMLDWSLDSTEPTRLERVNLEDEPQAIEGLRKRPGPFFQDAAGAFGDLNACASVASYCAMLKGVCVFRLTGLIDFDKAFELIEQMDT
ncbi:HprK-related kinase B [Neptunomonas antarctica]|uniref:HprK-related kinase B n=1 Tax=Neptunomonas antarctica TaxID=619304 RepID=A0A1N7KHE7_9GAMM|nr:HprK-related kinase B [Neptunomonas antarctica]SIS61031.1 HprK-related kinase B [Neptunomonas antarctica]